MGRSHGWSLDGIHIHQMEPLEENLAPEQQVTLFHPSELELSETTSKVLRTVEEKLLRRRGGAGGTFGHVSLRRPTVWSPTSTAWCS